MLDQRLAALEDRLRRPVLHPRPRRPRRRRRRRLAQEQGVQGDGRGDQEVGQGEVRRLLDATTRPAPSILQAAAEGGFVDAIMVQYTPWLDKDAPAEPGARRLPQAGDRPDLDEAGRRPARTPATVPRRGRQATSRSLKEKGLTPYQGLLHAIWTDERISTCCVSMRNTDQIRENTEAARTFEPLEAGRDRAAPRRLPRRRPDLLRRLRRPMPVAAGTEPPLGDLTRFLTYHEHHGYRAEARADYAALEESPRLERRRPRSRASRLPEPARLRRLLPKVDRHLA